MLRRMMAVLLLVAGVCAAAPIIGVYTALAPNRYGSPNFSTWESTAVYALEHGLSAYGDPASPSYYEQVAAIPGGDLLVTSFHSWKGSADPVGDYGPAFANELGTRPTIGFVANGNGEKISISELSFTAVSDDIYALMGYSYAPGSFSYSSGYVGIVLNADGSRTYVTSGPSTQLVDIIVGRGSGNAFWPCDSADVPCATIDERQAAMNDLAKYNGTTWHINGTYSLVRDGETLAEGTGGVTVNPIPEPATFAMLGGGVLAMLACARMRRP